MTDDSLFDMLNFVMVGWVLLAVAPKWKWTLRVVLFLVVTYSGLYLVLLARTVANGDLGDTPVDFSSLDSVVNLFKLRPVVFAGWTHYIAYDLLVGMGVTMHATQHNIPHVLIVCILPMLLMAGPVGLFVYTALFFTLQAIYGSQFPDFTTKQLISRAIYVLTSGLCVFMVSWIFVFPGTWRQFGSRSSHAHTLAQAWGSRDMPTPLSLVQKYADNALVRFTHILPSGIWALCVPLQFHPILRKDYKKLHRASGYALLLCSLLLSVGVQVILYRKLGFIESDFPQERVAFLQRCGNTDNSDSDSGSSSGHQAKCSLFERMSVSLLHEDTLNRDAFLITAAFVLFGWWALQAAKRQHWLQHKQWMYRHVGLGMWVSIHRVIVLTMCPSVSSPPTAQQLASNVPQGQMLVFMWAIPASVLLSCLLAELAIWAELPLLPPPPPTSAPAVVMAVALASITQQEDKEDKENKENKENKDNKDKGEDSIDSIDSNMKAKVKLNVNANAIGSALESRSKADKSVSVSDPDKDPDKSRRRAASPKRRR